MTLTAVREVVCIHNSTTVTTADGDVTTCRTCGQKILTGTVINEGGEITGVKETVLERGCIGGVMTAVHPPKIDHRRKEGNMAVKIEDLPAAVLERAGLDNPDVVEGRVSGTVIELKPKAGAGTVTQTEALTVTKTKAGKHCQYCGLDFSAMKVHGEAGRHVRWCPQRPDKVKPTKTKEKALPAADKPAVKGSKPKVRRRFLKERNKDKEAIIADYQKLTIREFYLRWRLNSRLWKILKAEWKVESKGRGGTHQVITHTPPIERHITVHVYQLADGFPKFTDCRSDGERMEWLRCYRDMAMHSPEKIKVELAAEAG